MQPNHHITELYALRGWEPLPEPEKEGPEVEPEYPADPLYDFPTSAIRLDQITE